MRTVWIVTDSTADVPTEIAEELDIAVLSLQSREVLVWGKVRTRSKTLKRLVAQVREWGSLTEMAVLHTGAEELAKGLVDAFHDLVPANQLLMLPAGPALTTHLGLGAVALAAVMAARG